MLMDRFGSLTFQDDMRDVEWESRLPTPQWCIIIVVTIVPIHKYRCESSKLWGCIDIRIYILYWVRESDYYLYTRFFLSWFTFLRTEIKDETHVCVNINKRYPLIRFDVSVLSLAYLPQSSYQSLIDLPSWACLVVRFTIQINPILLQ